ncbi:putative AH domain-containing protein [Lupinus albus]|uniref:Putative AH domain-containing protein n=1 Tax=Lupinus albus TaxID=3870 RepID=A0A6A4PIF4_LUPAL|nr:putative AH domain-containing protein [Lupinus albus]
MDAFRKHANKLRDQVSKQQQLQAVIKQFSSSGYEKSDVVVIDEVEMQRHQQLEKLYRATRTGRDFQKEIVKAAETFTAIGYKHIETGTKLSEDCCQYGAENSIDNILAKAASVYGDARKHVEKEQEELNQLLSSQVHFSYFIQVY